MEGARLLFQKRWRKLTTPAIAARLKSIFHVAALILATTAIGGMYVKGLANEYRAVWESTFFTDSSQLRPFLNLVLGPASALTGQALPSADTLDKIHWKADESEVPGDNAAIWIHWYAITVALFVIIPRGLLAMLWQLKSLKLERTLPYREVSPDYFYHLLAVSTGNSVGVSLVPYPVSPADESKHQILRTLEDHFQKPVEISWMAAIPFGNEEEPIRGLEGEVIPLFDFSSTPEKETHLAMVQNLLDQEPDSLRNILLETSRFDEKASRFSDGEEKRADRMKAWVNLFETLDVKLVPCHNNQPRREKVNPI